VLPAAAVAARPGTGCGRQVDQGVETFRTSGPRLSTTARALSCSGSRTAATVLAATGELQSYTTSTRNTGVNGADNLKITPSGPSLRAVDVRRVLLVPAGRRSAARSTPAARSGGEERGDPGLVRAVERHPRPAVVHCGLRDGGGVVAAAERLPRGDQGFRLTPVRRRVRHRVQD
jgi:hypothetical protein